MIRCYWRMDGSLGHVQEFDQAEPLPEIVERTEATGATTEFRITEHTVKDDAKVGADFWFENLELSGGIGGEPDYSATTPVGDKIPTVKTKDYIRPGVTP